MSNLEKLTHTALILVSATALIVLVHHEFFSSAPSSTADPAAKLVGRRLDFSGFVAPSGAGVALVVVAKSDCVFCVASLPLYREVDRLRGTTPGRLSLYFATPEPEERFRRFIEKADIAADKITSVKAADLARMGIIGTPTVLVVDSSGRIRKAYSGKMGNEEESELLETAKNGSIEGELQRKHDPFTQPVL
jgi:hypothetical protein